MAVGMGRRGWSCRVEAAQRPLSVSTSVGTEAKPCDLCPHQVGSRRGWGGGADPLKNRHCPGGRTFSGNSVREGVTLLPLFTHQGCQSGKQRCCQTTLLRNNFKLTDGGLINNKA